MKLDRVEEAIEEIRLGRMVIVADDEDRENEGDLVMAAAMVTPEDVNFMRKHAGGLICVTLTPERADDLELPPMSDRNTDPQGTAFTIAVDAHERFGVTTGISAHDRAKTIEVLTNPETVPGDLPPARAHVPAPCKGWWRLAQGWPNRSRSRPRDARGASPRWRHLRDPQRGRHDGASSPTGGLRPRTRAQVPSLSLSS